jgi:hypothetical protein
MSAKQAIKDAGDNLNYLLIIGFLGIVWLMIYGNLSGNIGFGQTSSGYVNQTITLSTAGASPAGTSGKVNPALSNVVVTNATSGKVVVAANYTYTGATFTNLTGEFGGQSVNVSYTISYDTAGKVDTDTVIGNMTSGTKTFFGFSNTIFTIAAIVLLISILLGLVAVVMKIVNISKKKGNFASE